MTRRLAIILRVCSWIDFCVFHALFFLMMVAYVNCITVVPGTVPDSPDWQYAPVDVEFDASTGLNLQEARWI